MGQFSMEISGFAGSVLSGNQQRDSSSSASSAQIGGISFLRPFVTTGFFGDLAQGSIGRGLSMRIFRQSNLSGSKVTLEQMDAQPILAALGTSEVLLSQGATFS